MIVTCVHVHVKTEAIDRFIEATIANHRESLNEPAADHKKTPHYLEWRDKVADWMAEPRKGVKYNIIEPKDRSQW
jgi:autoinducer 2-degrading protein